MSKFIVWLQKQRTTAIISAFGILMLIGIGGTANAALQFTGFFSEFGSEPALQGLTEGQDGNFYGVTDPGAYTGFTAVFYKVTSWGLFTPLYTFDYPGGYVPFGKLLLAPDGNFYGVTHRGGANNGGVIYRISPAGIYATIYSFELSGGGGGGYGITMGADGNIYGLTAPSTYGPVVDATIFKLSLSGQFTVLYTFSDSASSASHLLQGPDGNLYGIASGSEYPNGYFFKLSPLGSFTVLYVFSQANSEFSDLTVGLDGNFYGSIANTLTYDGEFFRITPAGAITTVCSYPFAINNFTYGFPVSQPVLGADGNFYFAFAGGSGNPYGSFFEITPEGAFTTLYSITSTDFAQNPQSLIQSSAGDFYGTTPGGDYYTMQGDVFKLTSSPLPVTTMNVTHSFGILSSRVTLQATITAADGTTVPSGSTVTFYLDHEPVATSTTNDEGIARFSYNVPGADFFGYHSLFDTFITPGAYTPCSGTGTFTLRYVSEIRVPSENRAPGSDVSLDAKLYWGISVPDIGNLPIMFSVDGSPIGTTLTDDHGEATISYPISLNAVPGTRHTITATFAGNERFLAVSGTGTLTVN